MELPFKRLAIVNRGEPAIRAIRAVSEINNGHSTQLSTIALYTDADRNSAFVRLADEALHIGPATVELDGKRTSAYLDYARLEDALRRCGADAVWVGWGFVAEHASFADLCGRLSVTFVGPTGEVMRQLGDKIGSKRLAEQSGVPVAPWSNGPMASLEEAREHAERIGYPLLVKAAAGGGGRGIRRVSTAQDLEEAYSSSRSEALKAFGDDTVFLERMVVNARHVEVQIIGDHHGTVWAIGVRDCSIQRRNQKLIEEAPSPALSPETTRALKDHAVQLARSAGYQNAGTAEFLYSSHEKQLCFMEMNTRLQVEHTVTEETTGIDLVKLQLQVAAGYPLEGDPPPTMGHSIEVRLNAEDPDNSFAPSPGTVDFLRFPAGPGVRVDAGIGQGDAVPPEFDSMVGKIITHGRDREEAMGRLRRALLETAVAIRGGTTNRAFLLEVIDHPDFHTGEVDIGWLDRFLGERRSQRPLADVALIQVAVESYESYLAIDLKRFISSVVRGRPRVTEEVGVDVELRYDGQSYRILVNRIGDGRYSVMLEQSRVEVRVSRQNAYENLLFIGDQRHRVFSVRQGMDHRVEVDGMAHHISRDEGGVVRAPAPAIVLSISVKVGDLVSAGDRLMVLEAMKMEMPVLAPVSGQVKDVAVHANVQVDAGTPLVMLESTTTDEAAAVGERVSLSLPAPIDATHGSDDAAAYHAVFRKRCRTTLNELRSMVLGYDVDPREGRSMLRELLSLRGDITADDAEIHSLELDLLNTFVDVVAIGVLGDPHGSSPSLLANFLRSFLIKKEDLPLEHLEKLKTLFKHFGVFSIDGLAEEESALYWIGKAHYRVPISSNVIEQLLEWHWHNSNIERLSPAYRRVLDRLIEDTRDRCPGVNALARQIRYRHVERPLLQQAHARQHELMRTQLRKLAEAPATTPLKLDSAFVNSPYPVLPLMREVYISGNAMVKRTLLEGYLRRFYRQNLLDVRVVEGKHHLHGIARYISARGTELEIEATYVTWDDLEQGLEEALQIASSKLTGKRLLVDLLVHIDGSLSLEVLKTRIKQAIETLHLLPHSRRLCVSALTGKGPRHLTYASQDNDIVEVALFRDIHHMRAERLELWRLKNFEIERVPSSEEHVLVFRAVAKDNPKDRRLFAFVDIRDMMPVRNEQGQLLELPHLERLYAEALATFREIHHRSPTKRYDWNRVYLHPWSNMDLSWEDLGRLATRLAQPARGLGLEKIVIRGKGFRDVEEQDALLHINIHSGIVMRMRIDQPGRNPIRVQSDYARRVMSSRRRGFIYPYEIIRMLTPKTEGTSIMVPLGNFVEYDLDSVEFDLDSDDELVPVEREYGENTANIVIGVITNYPRKHPEGMTRVIILGDPSRRLGALAEPECKRIVKALDLAEKRGIPVEWFPLSSGAKISMTSGTENLDWTARVLRRIVEFTEAGGEINLIVNGINVGAQSYWNAEATMLMHTRGILVMTPSGSMVLTGKKALDYSGGVSAEDNLGIGGMTVMGPNGQVQYSAREINHACMILFHHYNCTYVKPGERLPRRSSTRDPFDRSIMKVPHRENGECAFKTVGEIFSNETNPGRKKPFAVRSVMKAVIDQDQAVLERWELMRDAEMAVVMDVHLGGIPACLIGIESRRVPRVGFVPGDGPEDWTGGTLFPLSSKKVARAINSASGNRPVVVLANLAGFDGSPESMRKLQLEYGAEIGRAVVRFDGPIIFCVIARYHGGAYVVFSRTLNDNLESAAVEGSYASVIGGAPATAVVLPNEVQSRTYADPEVQKLRKLITQADDDEKPVLLARLNTLVQEIKTVKQRELAAEYDEIHSIERARSVGSLHHIVSPAKLRPYLIGALERGILKVCDNYPMPS